MEQSAAVDGQVERKYTTISIPTSLYKTAEEQVIKGDNPDGYRSVTEFIVDSTRRELRQRGHLA